MLALAFMDVGGVHVGAVELGGVFVGGDGLALSLVFLLVSRDSRGGMHWWR